MYQSTTMQAFIADRGAGLAGFVRGRAEMVSRARTRVMDKSAHPGPGSMEFAPNPGDSEVFLRSG
jgi:hypothetical protein